MAELKKYSKEELLSFKAQLTEEYNSYKAKELKLDMSRGKPAKDQLDLSNGILDVINSGEWAEGTTTPEYRNYGILDGVEECKKMFADHLEDESKNVIVCGNSSLNMMFD